MTVRCDVCGVVAKLEKHEGEWLCPDCVQCSVDTADSYESPYFGASTRALNHASFEGAELPTHIRITGDWNV